MRHATDGCGGANASGDHGFLDKLGMTGSKGSLG